MRYLIVGQGGREHAIVRALTLSPTVSEIHVVPGSDGISQQAICHDVDLENSTAVETFARRYRFDCVILGETKFSSNGLADRLRALGLAVVGASGAAAVLEHDPAAGEAFVRRAGVRWSAVDPRELTKNDISVPLLLGTADVKTLPIVRFGPNNAASHGVGAHEGETDPWPRLREEIITPIFNQLTRDGLTYRGALTVRVRCNEEQFSVRGIEMSLGSPEAQVILPLLDGDWGLVFANLAHGRPVLTRWTSKHTACVTGVASGDLGALARGGVIDGDLGAQTQSSYFIHAGTARSRTGQWVVNARRVIDAIGIGNNEAEALHAAEAQMGGVNWKGLRTTLTASAT